MRTIKHQKKPSDPSNPNVTQCAPAPSDIVVSEGEKACLEQIETPTEASEPPMDNMPVYHFGRAYWFRVYAGTKVQSHVIASYSR